MEPGGTATVGSRLGIQSKKGLREGRPRDEDMTGRLEEDPRKED